MFEVTVQIKPVRGTLTYFSHDDGYDADVLLYSHLLNANPSDCLAGAEAAPRMSFTRHELYGIDRHDEASADSGYRHRHGDVAFADKLQHRNAFDPRKHAI